MSSLGILIPLAVVTVGPISWAFTNWVRARHGYPIDGKNGQLLTRSDPEAQRTLQLLASDNERQSGQISRLEARIAVLERIATDPAERTAREIEALRTRD